MPTINRPLAGPVLAMDLDEQVFRLTHSPALQRSGRSARTLVKDGPLRVTLVTLGGGGDIAEHTAEGPITVQPIYGSIRVRVGEDEWRLEPGDLLSIGARVPHAVDSERGGIFLLTVTAGGRAGKATGEGSEPPDRVELAQLDSFPASDPPPWMLG